MGCNCGSKAKAAAGTIGMLARRSGLWPVEWNDAIAVGNRSALHASGAGSTAGYRASGVADASLVAAAAPPDEFPTVVDFGAGDGRVTLPLTARYPTVYAVDASPAALKAVRVEAPLATRWISDGSDLLDRTGPVDVVVALGVLDRLPVRHGRRILDGLVAALRPGGRLVVTIPVDVSAEHDVDPDDWTGRAVWTAATALDAVVELGLVDEVPGADGELVSIFETPLLED